MATARRAQFSVGLLVLVGAGLLVGFVLFLTQDRVTGRDAIFETYIRESVQGLEVGSAVRYRGVAVGRVTHVGLAAADYRREGRPFEMAFQLVVVRFAVRLDLIGDVPSVEEAVREGLRARVASQGITGVSNIELDFRTPDLTIIAEVPWTPRYPWIPAVPSTVAQIQSVAETLMRQLAAVDLSQLVGNIDALLGELRAAARGADLGALTTEASALLTDARGAIAQADLPALAQELRTTVAATRALLDGEELRVTSRAMAASAQDLRATAQRLPALLTQVEAVLRAARGTTTDFQAELAPLLRDLRATTANLRDTTEALRRSPSQTLLGAPPPPGPGR
jgi:ABC-type transporter Mla subunit MlaD